MVLAMPNYPAFSNAERPVLIAIKEVCRRTSLSRASLYRLMAKGAFPRLVPLTGTRKAFVEADVDAWIAARIAARGNQDVAALGSDLKCDEGGSICGAPRSTSPT